MADPHAKMTKATPREVMVSVVLGLFAPLVAIVLIVFLVNSIQSEQVDEDSPEIAEKAVLRNIAPVAKLDAQDASAQRVERSGEEIYNAVCVACHTSGALGAPKLNSKGDWGARIAQGYETLVNNAINGIRAMPRARRQPRPVRPGDGACRGIHGQYQRRQLQGARGCACSSRSRSRDYCSRARSGWQGRVPGQLCPLPCRRHCRRAEAG